MTEPTDPDRAFALGHAPRDVRDALGTLWALDARLGEVVATTSQPLIGQMRLTWWYDALAALDTMVPVGEPLLADLATWVLPSPGIDGKSLAGLVEGWEVLLESLPLADSVLETHALERGTRLFGLSAAILGGGFSDRAGAGWALADFAGRCSDPDTSTRAYMMARAHLSGVAMRRMPRPLRILARLAAADAQAERPTTRGLWRLMAAAR